MAKKSHPQFMCTACGAVQAKWTGQCEACKEWNTIKEIDLPAHGDSRQVRDGGKLLKWHSLKGKNNHIERIHTGIGEFDRVLGGGLVPGSIVLVGGDPGIGKSTLLLQAAAYLTQQEEGVVYISGEESVDQIRMRAKRLGIENASLSLASSINLSDILNSLNSCPELKTVIIDSIQTMWLDTVSGVPGSVSQVKACAFELIRAAKTKGFSLILVGHVTKEGGLAGPRVLEHMVDGVLYFEGERGHQFRILRAAKNRYGATDEIGVFSMTDKGMREVENPSALFLAERRGNIAGSAVFAGMEGTRPLLLEIQILLAPKSSDSAPRRSVIGWDVGRFSMLLAVLHTRCGFNFSHMDIYMNIAGGIKVTEPAADFAVAAALISALLDKPTRAKDVYFGEVGLSGELRQVPQAQLRIKEAAKLGFTRIYIPRVLSSDKETIDNDALSIVEVGNLRDIFHAQGASS